MKFKLLVLLLIMPCSLFAQQKKIVFDEADWETARGEVTEYLGRRAFQGTGAVKDSEFQDGIIEFDLAVTGARSYPGVAFRIQSPGNYENFYIRPHKSGLTDDALQYTPVINKVAGWQLYHGEGYTSAAKIKTGEWMHVKIEVAGAQARVFIEDMQTPAMVMPRLEHGITKGGIGLSGPANGTAYFSNLCYTPAENMKLDIPEKTFAVDNSIKKWELSKIIKADKYDLSELDYPRFTSIFFADWKEAETREDGLLDIARFAERTAGGPDMVMLRKYFYSEKSQTVKFDFGYSDEVAIFLNGKKIFYGHSAYKKRDSGFAGILGFNDAVYLPLEKGINEIYLFVKETFGGFGIKFRPDISLPELDKNHGALTKLWETPAELKAPESVVYDKKRNTFYVSNFDVNYRKMPERSQFISRLSFDGKIEKLKWVDSLTAPCGLEIFNDKLYVAERGFVSIIDIETAKIVERYKIEGSEFLNDLVVADDGSIYITDTSPSSRIESRIYKLKNGEVTVWLNTEEVSRANGLTVSGKKLLLGNSGDGILKSVDLENKKVEKITALGAGVQDGIKTLSDGSFIVSHWEGKIFRIDSDGKIIEIADLRNAGCNAADFEYIPDLKMLIVPAYLGNKVMAYRVN